MAQTPVFQALLFGNDGEALAEQERRRVQRDQAKNREAARRITWPLDDTAQNYAVHHSARTHPTPVLPFPELRVFDDNGAWAWDRACLESTARRPADWSRGHRAYEEVRPKVLLQEARRRAERMGCRIGKNRIQRIYELANGETPLPCYWCKRLTERLERQVYHKVPLIRGGAHAAGNLCVSCWQCNLAKGDRLPEEFLPAITSKKTEYGNSEADRRNPGQD